MRSDLDFLNNSNHHPLSKYLYLIKATIYTYFRWASDLRALVGPGYFGLAKAHEVFRDDGSAKLEVIGIYYIRLAILDELQKTSNIKGEGRKDRNTYYYVSLSAADRPERDKGYLRAEIRTTLRKLLRYARLTQQERICLVLSEYDVYTNVEVSDLLDCSPQATHKFKTRAIEKIRKLTW